MATHYYLVCVDEGSASGARYSREPLEQQRQWMLDTWYDKYDNDNLVIVDSAAERDRLLNRQ